MSWRPPRPNTALFLSRAAQSGRHGREFQTTEVAVEPRGAHQVEEERQRILLFEAAQELLLPRGPGAPWAGEDHARPGRGPASGRDRAGRRRHRLRSVAGAGARRAAARLRCPGARRRASVACRRPPLATGIGSRRQPNSGPCIIGKRRQRVGRPREKRASIPLRGLTTAPAVVV
jgi:hypothetical protein